MNSAGSRIRTKRKEIGLSQAHLASLAGISQSAISELETGESKMPSAEALQGLAKALRVTQAWIITGHDGELETLTTDEENLVKAARKLTAEQRVAVYQIIKTMAKET